MVTHHPSLLRAPFPTGLRHRTSHAFLLTAAVHSPPPPPLRLRSLRAAAGEASPVVDDGGKRATPPSLGAKVLYFARSNFLPLAKCHDPSSDTIETQGSNWWDCFRSPGSYPWVPCSQMFPVKIQHFWDIPYLRTDSAYQGAWCSIRSLACWTFGLGSILLFTPFLAQFIVQIQFFPREFITGLAMFCCMPTTLSSGVTLTQLVGGNSALALAMTVLSNLLGIMFVPVSLAKYIGVGAWVTLPSVKLFKSLVNTLLIPLILGKVARETSKDIAEFVDGNRKSFSVISAVLLSLVPWIQVSRSRSLLLSIQAKAFATTVTIGVLLHLALLAFNATALQVLSCFKQKEESVFVRKDYARAVILVASQKTLPVLVAVVEQLGGALGESGLLVIPCVAAHINQIIIDSILVNWWHRRDQQCAIVK